jgi:RimJ/RimL family protein N-acetyltransferase
MPSPIAIRELNEADAEPLATLLVSASATYRANFFPFEFSQSAIAAIVRERRLDHYWVMEAGAALVGFFMLRGFDEGYQRPSFGVFVDEAWHGRGYASQALEYALRWCWEHNVQSVMLKVAPDNAAARHIYAKAGFLTVGTCDRTGHLVQEWRICETI